MSKWPNNPYRSARKSTLEAIARDDEQGVYNTLTVRQRRFAEEYVIDFNGQAAAIRAGYTTKHPEKIATALLRHEGVAYLIDSFTRSKEAKIVSVDPDYIIQQVVAIISGPDAKNADRLRGLELLARHLGMFIDRTELTGKDGGPLEYRQKVEEDAQTFTNLLKQLQERADAKKDQSSEREIPVRPDGERLPS